MSIAFETTGRSGFSRGISSCSPKYESPEIAGFPPEGRRRVPPPPPETAAEDSAASCSSSIGRNSDCSEGEEESEVQSSYKGPLDTMDALEDSLPIRRGISSFYCGKSKSFTSLADTLPSSSAKNLAKPENSYTRKRKNLLAFSYKKPHRPSGNGDITMTKRPTNSIRTTLGHCQSMSSSSSGSTNTSEDDLRQSLPPLHPQGKVAAQACSPLLPLQRLSFPVRSFSLTDLEGAASSSSSIESEAKPKRFH